jgi:hypothetical protein
VTVNDVEDPVITCPNDNVVDNDVGFCSAVVKYDFATAIDNCVVENVGLTDGIMSDQSFPVGSTTNTFNATDKSGNNGNLNRCCLVLV